MQKYQKGEPRATNSDIRMIIVVFFVCTLLVVPTLTTTANAEANTFEQASSFRWNNSNWFTEPHPKVLSFTVQKNGDAYGLTETGVSFVQYTIKNEAGIRIQRFEMQDHYHYIVDGEIVYTHAELSAKLAEAYRKQHDHSV